MKLTRREIANLESKYDAIMKVLAEALQIDLTANNDKNQQTEYRQAHDARIDIRPNMDDIPLGVSNRHIHLSQTDLNALFGEGYQLTRTKDLSQPGQYACKETVILCGPKGVIENVRVLGPVRNQTQAEVLTGDCFKLGITAPPRLSGDLIGTPGITLAGPKGAIRIKEGLITALRHIHMTLADASRFGVADGQTVSIQIGGACGGIYHNVLIRANDSSSLECHLDTEEANAMKLSSGNRIKIIK